VHERYPEKTAELQRLQEALYETSKYCSITIRPCPRGPPAVNARQTVGLVAIALVFCGLYVARSPPRRGRIRPSARDCAGGAFSAVFSIPVAAQQQHAVGHSATALEIPGGKLRAFWYGGTREGASM